MGEIASPPEIFDDFIPTARQQKIYVGKHGDDSSAGSIPDQPKLTIQSAVTQAGTPASEAAAVVVEVMDDGEYDEDITCSQYVNIFAPRATIKGQQTLADDMYFVGRRFINDGNASVISKASSGSSFVRAQEIWSNASGSVAVFQSAGKLKVRAEKIEATVNQAVGMSAAGGGDLDLEAQEIIATLECAQIAIIGSGVATIRAGRMSGGTGIKIFVGGTVTAYVGDLNCTTAYDVPSGGMLRLFAGELSGTETAVSGADARVFRTNLWHLHPYLVGPVGSAPYQTIQDAINAADGAGGGDVWVLPDTYAENLTVKSGVNVRAVFTPSTGYPIVKVDGTVRKASGFVSMTFEGIYFDASGSSGTDLVVVDADQGYLNFHKCRIKAYDARAIYVNGAAAVAFFTLFETTVNRQYSAIDGECIKIVGGTSGYLLLIDSYVDGDNGSVDVAVDVSNGGVLRANGYKYGNVGFAGKINVSGGSNSTVVIVDSTIQVASGDHVTVTGSLTSSYYEQLTSDDRDPIQVGGTNASQFVAKPSHTQVIYVSKSGNDNYDGLHPDRAKLTIAAAITAAGTPASAADAVVVRILDDGTYTESTTPPQYVSVYGPNARVIGRQILTDDTSFDVGYAEINSSNLGAFDKQSGSGRAFARARHIKVTGAGRAFQVTTSAGSLVGEADFVELDGGVLVSAGGTNTTLRIGEISAANASYVIFPLAGICDITAGAIRGTSADSLVIAFSGTGEMNVNAGVIDVGTIFTGSATDHDLNIVASRLAYTTLGIPDGMSYRATGARRDTTATVDPTANDDSTDGYTVGSTWINTATDRIWICVDATATAAIWVPVPNGGEVQLQTTDGSTVTAATIPLSDPDSVMIHTYVVARQTNGVGAAGYERRGAFYRNGGAAVQISTIDTPFTRETFPLYDHSMSVSGNNVLLTVTGRTGEDIEWRVRYTLERM